MPEREKKLHLEIQTKRAHFDTSPMSLQKDTTFSDTFLVSENSMKVKKDKNWSKLFGSL